MNRWCGVGRLGQKPELKFSQGGTAYCRISIAIDRRYGEQKTTDWIPVTCFGKLAETVANYLDKGRLVAVEGRLEVSAYEKEGERRTSFQIVADNVRFLDRALESTDGPGGFEPDSGLPF